MVSLVNEISRVKASFPSSAKNNAIRNSTDEGVGRARAKANKEKADEDDTIPLTGALNG